MSFGASADLVYWEWQRRDNGVRYIEVHIGARMGHSLFAVRRPLGDTRSATLRNETVLARRELARVLRVAAAMAERGPLEVS